MLERRGSSLLDFAIAASIAIVPIMVGIVLLVAVVRPADPGAVSWRGTVDSYASVRHVAALKTFQAAIRARAELRAPPPTARQVLDGLPQCQSEWGAAWRASDWLPHMAGISAAPPSQAEHIAAQLTALDAALLRFGSRPNARVSQPVGFDTARWFALAASSLGSDIKTPAYPAASSHLLRRSGRGTGCALYMPMRACSTPWPGAAPGRHGALALAARPNGGNLGPPCPGQPMEGPCWLHLSWPPGTVTTIRPGHFVAGARAVQRRYATRPKSPVRRCRKCRRDNFQPGHGAARAERPGRRTRSRRSGRRHALDGAALAAHHAAAARVAAPALGHAVPPLQRGRRRA